MKNKNSKSPTTPIVTLAVGAVMGFVIAVLNFGSLGPLGFVVFGLSMVFAGIWVLTHYDSKWAKVLALSLILTPVIFIYVSVIELWLII